VKKLTITVPELAEALGVSRMTAYAAVRAGSIPSIRVGRRVLVPRLALERLMETAAAAVTGQAVSGEPLPVKRSEEGC
jgi:excisionase family DNA binding protein